MVRWREMKTGLGAGAGLMGVALLVVMIGSCATPGGRETAPAPRLSPADQPGPAVAAVQGEPLMRVRIAAGETQVELTSPTGRLTFGANEANAPADRQRQFATPVKVTRDAQGFLIESANQHLRWNLPALRVTSPQPVHFDGNQYPGTLVLIPQASTAPAKFDVIELTPLETYLPGVIAKELYSDWDPQAYRAQAIASRSYALYQRKLRAGWHYDIVDTTGGQVYIGLTQNPTALAAVRDTRGQVLAHDGYVVPAFFSADSGFRGANAADAYPGFPDMTPLRPASHQGLPYVSPHKQWGPIARNGSDLSKRIAAWGASRGNALAQVDHLERIVVTSRNELGRPRTITLYDRDGQVFEMPAEQFRLAANYTGPGTESLAPLAPVTMLKSSDIEMGREMPGGSAFSFRGYGFGHGVGLSQWHMQSMARAGWTPAQILGHFYPGATIVTLY